MKMANNLPLRILYKYKANKIQLMLICLDHWLIFNFLDLLKKTILVLSKEKYNRWRKDFHKNNLVIVKIKGQLGKEKNQYGA